MAKALLLFGTCLMLRHAGAIPSGGGNCSSPLDCNAQKCYDCSCTDGRCACADGWLDAHCGTPFCTNRTAGCSGHGSCRQQLHNITCSCDVGFSGPRCETATCQLVCRHGGKPNEDCTACEGCLGAWTGKLCDAWDSTVPAAELMRLLRGIANASQQMLDDQAQFKPVCEQGHECVGWGVDDATGAPALFPIVHLSYDPSRADKTFHGLTEPVEVEANHVVNPVWAFKDGANVFPRIEDFVSHVDTVYSGATPAPTSTNGVFSRSFQDVLTSFYQTAEDRSLSVVRASKSFIQMSLPVDPATKTRQYSFDKYAQRAVDSLPPAYDTEDHKSQFRFFIERYGTSFATSATLGGMVEQYARFKSWLPVGANGVPAFTAAQLLSNAQRSFTATTGLPGPSGALDRGYDAKLEPLACLGGDANASCVASFASWEKTIPSHPVLLDFEMAPITDLVTDPATKASLEAAVADYLAAAKSSWAAADKCPPSCSAVVGANCSASAGQSACRCVPGRVGNACSGCAPVKVEGTFTSPDGSTHTASAVIPCGGSMALGSAHFSCHAIVGIFNEGKCDAPGAAVCSRTADGNLVAHVPKAKCDITIPKHGNEPAQSGTCNVPSADAKAAGGISAASSSVAQQVKEKDHRGNCFVKAGKPGKECRIAAKCAFGA